MQRRSRRVLGIILTLTALMLTPVAATAEPAGTQCPAPDPASPKQQLRAEWIASVVNIDSG